MRTFLIAALLLVFNLQIHAQDKARRDIENSRSAPNNKSTRLTLRILRDWDRKPFTYTSVIIRFEIAGEQSEDASATWERKTDSKGFVVLEGVPTGTGRFRVEVKGTRVYDQRRELKGPKEKITVVLETAHL